MQGWVIELTTSTDDCYSILCECIRNVYNCIPRKGGGSIYSFALFHSYSRAVQVLTIRTSRLCVLKCWVGSWRGQRKLEQGTRWPSVAPAVRLCQATPANHGAELVTAAVVGESGTESLWNDAQVYLTFRVFPL